MSTCDLQRLSSFLDLHPFGREPGIKPILNRISSDLNRREQRGFDHSSGVVKSALSTLSRFRGGEHSDVRIDCLTSVFNYFFWHGHAEEALHAARQMELIGILTDDIELLGKSRNMIGLALADIGNIGEALLHYAYALADSLNAQNRQREAAVLINTGVALNYAGLCHEAVHCFENAIVCYPAFTGVARSNLAQSYLALDEHATALRTIELSLHDCGEPQNAQTATTRVIREYTCVQVTLGLHRHDLAERHVELCRRYGLVATQRGRWIADIATGLYQVHTCMVTAGIRLLERTLEACSPNPTMRADTLTALVKANDEAEQPEVALAYLDELFCLIRSRRNNSAAALSQWSIDALTTDAAAPVGLRLQQAKLRAKDAERDAKAARLETLDRLAAASELNEDPSGEHGYRVGVLASLTAKGMGWSEQECGALELAARLHDIGMIAIPDWVLRSSQSIREGARNLLQSHCEVGAELLRNSDIPTLRIAEQIARCHHERWDGSGYPRALAGSQIPIHARIVAIADVFDALTHKGSYSESQEFESALEEIVQRSGSQFDPALVPAFICAVSGAKLSEMTASGGRSITLRPLRGAIDPLSNWRSQHGFCRKATR